MSIQKLLILFFFIFSFSPTLGYSLDINVVQALRNSENIQDFHERMRMKIIEDLIHQGYNNFITVPYAGIDANYKIIPIGNFEGFTFQEGNIEKKDSLDEMILIFDPVAHLYFDILSRVKSRTSNQTALGRYREMILYHIMQKFPNVKLNTQRIGNIYLFRTEKDLHRLGYKLASSRERKNIDTNYRRKNISDAFRNIGNVRIINAQEEFSYNKNIHINTYPYAVGEAILTGGKIGYVRGGGLCGGSTAIYQGSITNGDFEFTAKKNHSKWWGSLYNANIDGKHIAIPGLDATIFSNSLDLKMKNTSSSPIILVMNYSGKLHEVEQVFTLSRNPKKRSIHYQGHTGSCYTWKIGEEEQRICYKNVY